MKIVVCTKHVPGGHLHFEPSSMLLDRSGEGELNKFDLNAVEEALRLKDEHGAEVVILSMGPERSAESIREALALGADRAILVHDPALAGSDLVATTKVIAKAVERENPDLVLFGQLTTDSGGSVLWASVAELLRLPYVSQATTMTLSGTTFRVRRQTEYGYDTFEIEAPAIIAVSDAINEPRYASLKGMMGAKKKPFETLTLADLGLDPATCGESGSKTTVRTLGVPPTRSNSTKIEDDGNAASAIFEFLKDKQLL